MVNSYAFILYNFHYLVSTTFVQRSPEFVKNLEKEPYVFVALHVALHSRRRGLEQKKIKDTDTYTDPQKFYRRPLHSNFLRHKTTNPP